MPFPPDPPAQVQKKQPDIKQESSGANSPNIVTGDHSNVVINQARSPRFHEKVENVNFHLGGGIIYYSADRLRSARLPLLNLNKKTALEAYMEGNVIFVDVSVTTAATGLLPVLIKHNEFPQPPNGWDRNFDDSAIEFVDANGDVVFQLIYQDGANVEINGVFAPEGGGLVIATKDGMKINPRPGVYPLPVPIFQYPSREHPGERAKK